MVLAAVADNSSFAASTVEIERDGPSYTIDTLKHFISLYGKEAAIKRMKKGDGALFSLKKTRFDPSDSGEPHFPS